MSAFLVGSVFASSIEKANVELDWGVMADAYYLENTNKRPADTAISNRNYDQYSDDFSLNLFELYLNAKVGNVGFNVDLDFGDFAEQNSGHDSDPQTHNIGQAYLTYEINGYTFSLGKMYTNVGYEVAKAQDNWNYSRSFAFSLGGPFWHEGFSVAASYDNGFGWGLYVYDAWDARRDSNEDKAYSAQLNYADGGFNIVYNFISGQEGTGSSDELKTVHEVNTQYDFSDNFSVALNVLSGEFENQSGTDSQKWNAVAAYLHYESGLWSFTPRFEIYTNELDGQFAEDGTTVIDGGELEFTGMTLTASYELEQDTELRFEVRQDSTSEDYYLDDGELTDSQSTISASWLFRM